MIRDKQNNSVVFVDPEDYIKGLVHDQANSLNTIITQVFENHPSTEDVALIRYLLQMLSVATLGEKNER
ncbi:hypothetical protein SAMN05216228_11261 [Rhizobium tibeticum]|uniref:Uncharacterized protein n=1 Tax=Rhizobium tibeticum TaxID=501024 RepID=A0ABY1AZ67_9HYPH|nr:hypothetical protein SAMN05216228_11261 [Rhizobium tibeticum]